MRALEQNYLDVVMTLIEYGALVDIADNEGRTSLTSASALGNEKVVDALLQKGADVNKQDNDSSTPLEIAARRGHRNIVMAFGTLRCRGISRPRRMDLPDVS